MSANKTFAVMAAAALLTLSATAVRAEDPEQWYFFVKNDTGVKMVGLEASEDKESWGKFDVGEGIAPGATDKLVWAASTDDDECNQFLRAVYADGHTSEPFHGNFCEDLDTPIVFERYIKQ